jgi:hypothetical protein
LRPEAPRITARAVAVTQANAAGLALRVDLSARNVSRVDLTVRSIDVRVTLAGRDLGLAHVPDTTRLPRDVDVPLSIQVTAPWQDLPGILLATALNEQVPYHLNGTARIGGERVNLDVPFQLDSTIPRSVLMGAATTWH